MDTQPELPDLARQIDETRARVDALSAQLQRFHDELLELKDRIEALEQRA
jgi:hypothetical protein